jgi:hypothetical protein
MDASDAGNGHYSLLLTRSEALVLFEWLYRVDGEDRDLGIVDQAEQRVLWDIVASFERVLVEPLDPNDEAIIDAARRAVRDPTE